MAYDGALIFETALDNKKLQQELTRLNRKIQTINDNIYKKEQEKIPLLNQAKELGAQLDAAKAKLENMQGGTELFTTSEIKQQQETVKAIQKEWDGINKKIESCDAGIQKQNIDLDFQKEKAGAIHQKLAESGVDVEKMDMATQKASKSASKFASRIKEVIRSALIFTLITQALARFREWMGKVVKTNAEATAAVARLKGALLTLAQPLVNVIIPAFTAFVNVLAKIVTEIANLISALFGTTVQASSEAAESLYNEQSAIEGVGSAAKKAGKSLASFDEINQLSNSSSGSSSGGTSEGIAPNFEIVTQEGTLDKILNLVKLIGAAFLYWKLPKALQGGLKTLVGLFMALDGAIGFVKTTWEAWQNGVTTENALTMIARAAELALGLFIALGPKLGPIAACISLIATGLTMLATGFHDAYENGWNFQNILLSIAGIMAAGIGISILTGSWIPALIAGIASILLAITTTYGDGAALIDGVMTMLEGFKEFFVGVFTGDLEKAIDGIGKIFDGLRTVIDTILDAVRNMFNSFLDWLDEKTGGKIHGIIEFCRSQINSFIDWISTSLSGMVDAAQSILEGIITFVSGIFTGDWDKAWEGVKEIFRGIVNGLITIFESFINLVIGGINNIIDGLNSLVATAGEFLGFDWRIPTVPKVSFDRIPALATGAVIPPNREFLAVLGDQKQGTNIEAPEALIRKIVREETAGLGNGEQTVVLQLDSVQLGKVVYRLNRDESRRIGVRLAEV